MSARRLIAIYGLLSVLQFLYVFLPGNPHFASTEATIFGVVVYVLLFWRLWYGSAIAWTLAVLMHALTLVGVVLFAAPVIESDVVAMMVWEVIFLGVLLWRPVRRHVWGPRLPATASPAR